MKNENSKRGC